MPFCPDFVASVRELRAEDRYGTFSAFVQEAILQDGPHGFQKFTRQAIQRCRS